MRTIKFRIIYKDKVHGYERLTEAHDQIFWEWMSPDLNPDNGTERWNRGVFPSGYKYIRNQFTGFKDNKNKEIYESDILSEKWLVSVYMNIDGTWMVKFGNNPDGNKPMTLREYLTMREQAGTADRDCIVVGNLYQSPELIQSKK